MCQPGLAGLSGALFFLVLPYVAPPACGQEASDHAREEVVAEIARLDSIWLNAYVTADVEAVRPILADDFVGQVSETIMDREAILQGVRTASGVEAMILERLVVNVYGDVAVAHAVRRRVSRGDTGTMETRFAYTDVYRFRDGRWACFTGQSAPISDGGS